jgi:solute carrier family 25 protein 39/40
MTQSQGYSSLWRGLTLTMWRDVPFSGLYWWGYETLRNSLAEIREIYTYDSSRSDLQKRDWHSLRSQQNSTTVFVDSFLAGCLSGAASAFVTTPFDVGKTRQQVFHYSGDEVGAIALGQSARSAATEIRPEQLTMPKYLYHIFHQEGFAGLFRGWAARCLKVAPACAIMISSYEIGKKLAQGVNERRNANSEADGDTT